MNGLTIGCLRENLAYAPTQQCRILSQTPDIRRFHVWKEVWLRRDDLKPKFRYHSHYRWQVVDGTPAVVNDEEYKIGPAHVSAVKWGEPKISYETDFVFAEVMAPVVYWDVDSKTGDRSVRGKDENNGA